MLNMDLLEQLLVIAIALSTITCSIVQKTKSKFKSSKYVEVYSFIINMIVGILFCLTFTNIKLPMSLWVGLFAFLGADTLYKSLEGRLSSYKDLISDNALKIPRENLIETDSDN